MRTNSEAIHLWPNRKSMAMWGLLLLSTSIIPWGLAGERPVWSWMLFSGRAYSTLGATLATAWTLGFIALIASRLLSGVWLALAYLIPGVTALCIFIRTTKGNLAPWTAFFPVAEPFPLLHILCVLLGLLFLLTSGLRVHCRQSDPKWLRLVVTISGILGIVVLGHSSFSVIETGWLLPGAVGWITIMLALLGSVLGLGGAILLSTSHHEMQIKIGRGGVFAALGISFIAGLIGPMWNGRAFSILFGAIDNGVLVAGISLITIQGVIGLCLQGPDFSRVSLNRTKTVFSAGFILAATLVFTVAFKGAHFANRRTAKSITPSATTAPVEPPHNGDWSQWCGSPGRNMVSSEKNLPDKFEEVSESKNVDLTNVKWVAPLNSHYVFGSPVVSEGKVLLGGSRREPGSMTDVAMLWCFNESDGKLLWQFRSPYIAKLYNRDTFGICSTPTIEGHRAYLLGHLGDVLCLDMNGQTDGNQGQFIDETRYFASGARCTRNEVSENGSRILDCTQGIPANLSSQDADILWRFDLLREVNCFPFNALNPSVLVRGDRLYVATCSIQSTTGDGSIVRIRPWEQKNNKKYDSPSLIVLDKNSGKLLARERQGIFNGTFHGAYSSPSLGKVNGKDLLFYGGGNGVCYAFDPEFAPESNGQPAELRLVWKFDCLDPGSYGPDFRIDHLQKAEIIGTPVFYKDRVYVTIGNDMIRSGEAARQGRLICIDATQTGDITQTGRIWSFDDIRSTASTVAVADGLIYTADASGSAYCLDADTGRLYWTHKTGIVWSSPLVADGKVYLGTHTNGLYIFEHNKEKKILFESGSTMDIVASPAVSHGALYIASQKYLYALEAGKHGGLTIPSDETQKLAHSSQPVQAKAPPSVVPVNTTDQSSFVQSSKNWSGFRGPGGSGIALAANPPTTWDANNNKNVSWRVSLPLPGNNSPIIWDNRIFLSGADRKHQALFCFELDSGRQLWRTDLVRSADAKKPEVIDDAGYAASTMVTDGRYACAMFASGLLACVDIKGQLVWQKELGLPDNHYGHASSLALWQNLLLIQFDQGSPEDEKSALIALDISTGNQVWSKQRPVGASWSTPIVNTVVMPSGSHDEVVTCSTPFVIAYSPKTGNELWRANVLSGEVAPSPVYLNGMVYACNAQASLAAIWAGGNGDVTSTHVAWTASDDLPDIVSPLCFSSSVYVVSPGGLLTSYDARKGALQWQHNFSPEQFRASPIGAENRIYLTSTHGLTHVLNIGAEFKEIGLGKVEDEITASPACAGNRLILRGKKTLYCLSDKAESR